MDSALVPVASTSAVPEAAPRESISSDAAARPVREDDYHSGDEEDEGDDQRLLLDEKRRARAGSIQFDFSSHILLASSDETAQSRRNGRGIAEPIGITAGIALIVGMQVRLNIEAKATKLRTEDAGRERHLLLARSRGKGNGHGGICADIVARSWAIELGR
jgi:hypothetical protein